MDPTYPDIDADKFQRKDWKIFYREMKDALIPDVPKSLGKEIFIRAFVDADFAGNKISRRSRTSFLVMMNRTPVYWHTKKQGVAK